MNISIRTIIIINIYSKNENILRANIMELSFVPLSPIFLTNIGIKAELKAPSANILRKKFGNRKAAKNTSDNRPTPINFAMRISLIKPNILDNAVNNDIVIADLKIAIF